VGWTATAAPGEGGTSTHMNATPLITVQAAATYLAVSASTIRRLVRSGELPARRIGTQLRFEQDVLESHTSGVATLADDLDGFDFAAAMAGLRYPRQ
jgi:excisionase family DNA binding protein